jgi:hypothetical protein
LKLIQKELPVCTSTVERMIANGQVKEQNID